MPFTNAEAVQQLKGKEFPVLDDGFVKLMDCLGDEETIIQSARVSYHGDVRPDEPEKDKALIKFLLQKQHLTPLEMCEIRIQCKVPMYVWRQWVRHRTATIMEQSARYAEADAYMQQTKPTEWRNQEGGFIPEEQGIELSEAETELLQHAWEVYRHRITVGVSREQARKDLPLSTYTLAYWKIDLRNLLHFLHLRMDRSAQLEIRNYAHIIGKNIISPLFPNVWEAFINDEQYCSKATKEALEEVK